MSLDRPGEGSPDRQKGTEKIKSPCVEVEGERFLAECHPLAWVAAEQKYPQVRQLHPADKLRNEGFVTSQDRFVSRIEALEIARKNNQVRESSYSKIGILTSEDFVRED